MEQKKKILFIINPISGIGKKKTLPTQIEKLLDSQQFEHEIRFTERKGHAFDIAENAARNQVDIVCVVGGDGSVHEAGSALVDSSTALAILPAGSGNGVARHLEIPLKVKQAIVQLNQGEYQTMDTVEINGKTMIGVAGFGFDALIAHQFDAHKKRGLWSYVKLVLQHFRKYKGVDVEINGHLFSSLFLCTIANTSQFGNGFQVSPESDVFDGKFELVTIKRPSFFGFFNLALSSLFGSIHNAKEVEIIQGPYLQMKIQNPVLHLDGEPASLDGAYIDVKIVPQSLKIWR